MTAPESLADLSPFDWGAGRAVLLVHGFSGTPFEMRFLGGRLVARGFRAIGLRLPGHGEGPEALERPKAEDWINEARAALLALPDGEPACIAGLSMGALVAAVVAADHPHRVAGLALCAPAVRLAARREAAVALAAIPFFRRLVRFIAKGDSDCGDPELRRQMPRLDRVPTAALLELGRLRALARRALPKVAAPTLVVYSEADRTVPARAARWCARRLGSGPARCLRLTRSSHVVTADVDRERVAEEIGSFFGSLGSPR